MMELRENKMLAKTAGEKYIWYPNISKQEVMEERQALEETSPSACVTIYSLEGAGHLEDLKHWKDALTNRTMTFKRNGFVFNDKNIKSLMPTGYIVFIQS